jgi:heme/copper-type cytochrome/quinol oxidase subunit 2
MEQQRLGRRRARCGRVPAWAVIIGLGVLGTACGSSKHDMGKMTGSTAMAGHEAASPTVPGAMEVAVTAKSFAFDPPEIHVRQGEDVTIALTATDALHDLTIDDPKFHVGAEPGKTVRGGLKVSRAGRYPFYCSVAGHKAQGMTGTLIVEPAG